MGKPTKLRVEMTNNAPQKTFPNQRAMSIGPNPQCKVAEIPSKNGLPDPYDQQQFQHSTYINSPPKIAISRNSISSKKTVNISNTSHNLTQGALPNEIIPHSKQLLPINSVLMSCSTAGGLVARSEQQIQNDSAAT